MQARLQSRLPSCILEFCLSAEASCVWQRRWVWNVVRCYSSRKSCSFFCCFVVHWWISAFLLLNKYKFTVVLCCFDKGRQVQHWARWKPEERLVAHRWHQWPGQTPVEGRSQRGMEGQDLLPLVPPTQTRWWLHQVPTCSSGILKPRVWALSCCPEGGDISILLSPAVRDGLGGN